MIKEFITAKEAANILKVNIMTIYRHINKYRNLPAYKIGKEFRINKKDFQHFLNKNKKN